MKISEMNEDQVGHMFYRLDKFTGNAMGFNLAICTGKLGDMDLVDAFQMGCGMNQRRAKIHARKVISFKLDPVVKLNDQQHIAANQRLGRTLLDVLHGLPQEVAKPVLEDHLKMVKRLLEHRR